MRFDPTKIRRINHVSELCEQHKPKLDRAEFLSEFQYQMKVSRGAAEKAFDGRTDLAMDVVEKAALFFGVTKEEILETKIIK